MRTLMLCVLILVCLISFSLQTGKKPRISNRFPESPTSSATSTSSEPSQPITPTVMHLKALFGSGCAYTASWFADVNLFRTVRFWIDITKMEAASFRMFEQAKWRFQLSDANAYYVHHLSRYEHVNHLKYGFSVAHNKSAIMAVSALDGECGKLRLNTSQMLALIPFYGGLPPNVTEDRKVKSLGQGNSLVDASTKAQQALATVCSCLKYFGNAVIGVARIEDRELMINMVAQLDPKVRQHINIVHFRLGLPAFLPFHLLAWGQRFVKHHNCHAFYFPRKGAETDDKVTPAAAQGEQWLGFHEGEVDEINLPTASEYDICRPNAIEMYTGGPVQVLFLWKSANFIHKGHRRQGKLEKRSMAFGLPLKQVYFSECDQIVHFDSMQTFHAIRKATNETTIFLGRRTVKARDSDPKEYMSGLDGGRECGSAGYSMMYPQSYVVHKNS